MPQTTQAVKRSNDWIYIGTGDGLDRKVLHDLRKKIARILTDKWPNPNDPYAMTSGVNNELRKKGHRTMMTLPVFDATKCVELLRAGNIDASVGTGPKIIIYL